MFQTWRKTLLRLCRGCRLSSPSTCVSPTGETRTSASDSRASRTPSCPSCPTASDTRTKVRKCTAVKAVKTSQVRVLITEQSYRSSECRAFHFICWSIECTTQHFVDVMKMSMNMQIDEYSVAAALLLQRMPSLWLPWRQTHLPCPLSSKELVQPTAITFNSEIKCCNAGIQFTPGSHHDRHLSIVVIVTITVVSSVISSDFLKKKTCEVQAFLRAIQLYRQDRGRYEAWDMLIGSDVRVRRVFLYLDPRCTNSTCAPGGLPPRSRRQELVLERHFKVLTSFCSTSADAFQRGH